MSSKVIFDDAVKEAVSWTNNDYGGLKIPAKRVVYLHESVKTWQVFGVTTIEEDNTPALYKRGIAHNKEDMLSTPWVGVIKARNPKPLGVMAGVPLMLRWCEALRGDGPRYVRSALGRA